MHRRMLVFVALASLTLSGATTCAGLFELAADCKMPMAADCSAAGALGADCCVVDARSPGSATVAVILVPGPGAQAPERVLGHTAHIAVPSAAGLGGLVHTSRSVPLDSVHVVLSVFLI